MTSIIDFYKRKQGFHQLHALECLEFISQCQSHLNLMQQERVLCWNVQLLSFVLECALLFTETIFLMCCTAQLCCLVNTFLMCWNVQIFVYCNGFECVGMCNCFVYLLMFLCVGIVICNSFV